AIQPEGRDGLPIGGEEDDRLLVSQRPGPLALANRLIFHAVFRHHEQEGLTGADRLVDLRVAIPVRPDIPLVEPGRPMGRPAPNMVRRLAGAPVGPLRLPADPRSARVGAGTMARVESEPSRPRTGAAPSEDDGFLAGEQAGRERAQ